MPTRVLVTGGAGFIGSSLVRALVSRGDRVRVLDNLSTGKRHNLAEVAGDVELIEGDLRDEGLLDRALVETELVFHEAAIASVPRSLAEPLENHAVNATGTLRLLDAARRAGVRRLVYAASSSAYGDSPVTPKLETMAPAPLSPYAVSKLAGEHYCHVYAGAFGVETVCLRYFNIFGPRQDPKSEYAAVVPRFVTAALAGQGVTIFGDGTQSRDFCHVNNVVDANLLAGAAPAEAVSGRTFNIGCGASISLNDLVRIIGAALGRTVAVTYAPPRAGDVKHSAADISAARAGLDYHPRVSLEAGLQSTIAWYGTPGSTAEPARTSP
jgi:UDP-N-acetylglucosamine/UDP-N-acetyl-alpha-D-glucosaminouronate 4-epimerase